MDKHTVTKKIAMIGALAMLVNMPTALAGITEGDYIIVSEGTDSASTYSGMRDKPVSVDGNEVSISRDMEYMPKGEYTPNSAVIAEGNVTVNTKSVEVDPENDTDVSAIRAADGAVVNVDGVVSDRMASTISGSPIAVIVEDNSCITIEGREGKNDSLSMIGGEETIGIYVHLEQENSTADVTVKKGNVVVQGGEYGAFGIESGEIEESGCNVSINIEDGDLNVGALGSVAAGFTVAYADRFTITANDINVECGDHPQLDDEEAFGFLAEMTDAVVNANINVSAAEGAGDVRALGMATMATNAVINGNVSTSGNADSGIVYCIGSNILITGDTETNGDHAILVETDESIGDSNITILGEMKGGDIAVSSLEGVQVVLGAAKLNDEGQSAIVLLNEEGKTVETTAEQQAQLNDMVAYIISSDDVKIANISGTEAFAAIDGNTYNIANLGDMIKVTLAETDREVETAKFYSDADQTIEIESILNEDGSYTLLWPSDKVDFRAITAVLSYIQKIDPGKTVTVKTKSTKTKSTKTGIGSKVKFAGVDWIITDIDAETGLYTLASVEAFTKQQLEDPQTLLDEILTDSDMAYVQKDENGRPIVSLVDETTADLYFKGNSNHLSIVTDPAFPRG